MFSGKIAGGFRYLKKNGIRAFINKSKDKLSRNDANYEKWFADHHPPQEELDRQRLKEFEYSPLISIVVPVFRTPENFLREMVESVICQSYPRWELCLADGSQGDFLVKECIEEYCLSDNRIKYKELNANKGIVGNTNAGIEMATGEFVAFMDHDDLLAPNALYEIVSSLNKDQEIDIIYTDEDKVSSESTRHFQPHFKADFNIDLLRSVNYISHLYVVRKKILDAAGYLQEGFEGAQDYDLVFRTIEKSKRVHHIPKILYHWRTHSASTAENPESKLYAFEAGKRAIEAHFKRSGIDANVKHGELYGLYRTIYQRTGLPLVSIIIANEDQTNDLKDCIESLTGRISYPNCEIIIVDNSSSEKATDSEMKNVGAEKAKGEYLVFTDVHASVITPECIEEMLGYFNREDVGVVGSKILYKNNTIFHAGIILGINGTAGYAFQGLDKDDPGYFARAIISQNYEAVSSRFMMTKKNIFIETGGFAKEFSSLYNGTDYCLRVRKLNKLVVYNPYVQLYYNNLKPEKMEDTFETEIFRLKWQEIIDRGDPNYNVNLSMQKADFTIKRG